MVFYTSRNPHNSIKDDLLFVVKYHLYFLLVRSLLVMVTGKPS